MTLHYRDRVIVIKIRAPSKEIIARESVTLFMKKNIRYWKNQNWSDFHLYTFTLQFFFSSHIQRLRSRGRIRAHISLTLHYWLFHKHKLLFISWISQSNAIICVRHFSSACNPFVHSCKYVQNNLWCLTEKMKLRRDKRNQIVWFYTKSSIG